MIYIFFSVSERLPSVSIGVTRNGTPKKDVYTRLQRNAPTVLSWAWTRLLSRASVAMARQSQFECQSGMQQILAQYSSTSLICVLHVIVILLCCLQKAGPGLAQVGLARLEPGALELGPSHVTVTMIMMRCARLRRVSEDSSHQVSSRST